MKKIVTYLIVNMAALGAVYAQGGNASASQATSLQLGNALDISFTNTGSATGSSINLNINTINKLTNGVTSSNQTLRVRSNENFAVSVKTNSTYFTYSGSVSPAPAMPASVLAIKINNNNTGGSIISPFNGFGALSSTDQAAINNGTNGDNKTFRVKYKATPGFDYPGGNYTIDVVYTATQI